MDQTQPYEKANQNLPLKKILWNNFIAGIAWALGATIGISIIFAILSIISRNINFVPIVGSFISDVIDFILKNNANLHK